MTIYRNTFENGTSGVDVTTANSGGGSDTAFSLVQPGLIYSDAMPHEGTLSGSYTSTSLSGEVRWTLTDVDDIAVRAYYYFTNQNSGGNFGLISIFDPAGNGLGECRLISDGRIRLYFSDPAGAWGVEDVMPTGQWVRVEFLSRRGSTNTSGQHRLALYLNNSPDPFADSGWLTGLNLHGDTTEIPRVRIGKGSTTTSAAGVYIDDIEVRTGVDYNDFIGPSTVELGTPEVRITGKTNPTSVGASDGSITVAWDPIAGADHYESCLNTGEIISGFVADDTNATSPKTYTGLSAGIYTVAVRAMVS